MKRRSVGVLALFQETNSFSPNPTGVETLGGGALLAGARLLERFRDADTEIAGFLDVLGDTEIIPLPSFWAAPGGPLTAAALALYCAKLEEALAALTPPPAGLLAAFHGCLASEDCADATGRVAALLRQRLPGVAIAATADFHANMSDAILRNTNDVVGYRTYPHTDLRETGRRAARRLLAELDAPTDRSAVCVRLPLIVPTETSAHDASPMRDVWSALRAVEARTGLPASCFCPHPWLDASDRPVTLLAYALRKDVDDISGALEDAASKLWESRSLFFQPMPGIEEAWRRACDAVERPVLLVDSGDVVLAGAPGDSSAILAWLAARETPLKALVPICDGPAALELAKASPGVDVTVMVGGRDGARWYSPVSLSGNVMAVARAPYINAGPYCRGLAVNAGARAALAWRGHTIVVTERPDPGHDPNLYRSLGLDPSGYDVVVVKSHNTFRPAYAGISRTVLRVATPGATTPDLGMLPFRSECRRLAPLGNPCFVAKAIII